MDGGRGNGGSGWQLVLGRTARVTARVRIREGGLDPFSLQASALYCTCLFSNAAGAVEPNLFREHVLSMQNGVETARSRFEMESRALAMASCSFKSQCSRFEIASRADALVSISYREHLLSTRFRIESDAVERSANRTASLCPTVHDPERPAVHDPARPAAEGGAVWRSTRGASQGRQGSSEEEAMRGDRYLRPWSLPRRRPCGVT